MIRITLLVALAAAVLACGSEGPAERAGRQIDEAMDSVRGEPSLGEKIDRTLSGGGSAQQAGRDVDEAVENAKKKAEEAHQQMQDAIEGS